MAVQIPQHVLDRIWDRIDVRGPDECWPWKLHIGNHGYGQVAWGRSPRGATTAHRAAWAAVNGQIPGDLTVDHICRNRPCCNPAHLRLLTNAENASNNRYKLQTHCPHGHPYDEANTRVDRNGWRHCNTCRRGRPERAIPGRICAECGGPIAPLKRPQAIYCDPRCAMAVRHRREKERVEFFRMVSEQGRIR